MRSATADLRYAAAACQTDLANPRDRDGTAAAGGHMLVDYDGRVLAQADPGPGEKIVFGPVDVAALRVERERRRGHHMLAHLRTEAYPAYRQAIYPGGR